MPSKPSRRAFLNTSLAAFGTAVTAGALVTPRWGGKSGPALKTAPAAAVTPQFQVPMPIPPVLRPTSTAGGTDTYRLAMSKAMKEVIPGVQTEVLTYGGSFPGQTIMATSDRPVAITHTNNLDTPVSVHLHGASVPQSSDGDPMDTIAPGASRTYTYPNKQTHAALWY
ncbi:bilirubin oxidase, partial [Streptomyces sp. NRRL B-1568]